MGKFDLAIEDYSKATELDSDNPFAYYNRGISQDRKGDYINAISSFTQAISIEPNKADFYHNRGFAYRKLRKYIEAIEDYSKAINLDPNHFKAFYNRAFCQDKTGDLQEAEKDYIKSLEINPQSISALHHLATIQEKIGDDRLELSLENFNKALELDSNYAPSFNGRGLVWDRMFNFEEGIADITITCIGNKDCTNQGEEPILACIIIDIFII